MRYFCVMIILLFRTEYFELTVIIRLWVTFRKACRILNENTHTNSSTDSFVYLFDLKFTFTFKLSKMILVEILT